MIGITPKQAECLDFMKAHIAEHGLAPTYRQIADHTGLHSTSGVHRIITGLEGRGAIRRIPGRARAMEIVDTETLHPLLSNLAPNVREAVIHEARKANQLPEIIVADVLRQWAREKTMNGSFA